MRATALLLLCLAAGPARAIELSLEENRAQRGNIGFVDMKKIFTLYPETLKAKENFEEVVRQTEEQVNLRKADLIRLRSELAALKLEREALAKAPPPPAPPPAPAPKISEYIPTPPQEEPPAPSTTAFSTALSTAPGPLIVALPGVSSATAAAALEAILASTPAAAAPPAPPAAAAPPSPLSELDGRITQKGADLAAKEAELKEHRASSEKNLLDLESRKTEIILGKIHKAVKTVARREGVSVVVDKGAILFGQDAVDLTERILKELKGP